MKALTLLIVLFILSQSLAFSADIARDDAEDFTDSAVGCVDDCLDPAN